MDINKFATQYWNHIATSERRRITKVFSRRCLYSGKIVQDNAHQELNIVYMV